MEERERTEIERLCGGERERERGELKLKDYAEKKEENRN